MRNTELYSKAHKILVELYGKNAQFREGQYEAIEAVLTNHRTLVVQRTGWGKSLVYFIAAKMLGGVTIIISPLLVLMDNQRLLAEKLGLVCAVFNSTVKGEERSQMLEEMVNGRYQVVFTTPETLYSKDVQQKITDVAISFFVVDECHCISDWGHDFRLEYGKLNRLIRRLPEHVSVLGTTATANDRVVEDLKKQFGEHVFISRGPLTRENLHIEILHMKTKAERYVWLKENLMKLPGSGIVYCLTRKDCQRLSDYLNETGISARPYYSDSVLEKPDELTGISYNSQTERLFTENRIKVIVATIKLGMGYDKSDIRFVIHFQQPGSLVAYYQQIGRSGRDGRDSYCFLMTGREDEEISKSFINNAFPTREQELAVVTALANSNKGLSLSELQKSCNISGQALNKTINMLLNQEVIYYEGRRYYRSVVPYSYAEEYYHSVRATKYEELQEIRNYAYEKGCLSKYVVERLNDVDPHDCGHCANCLGHSIIGGMTMPDKNEVLRLQERFNSFYIEIEPRKRWMYPSPLDRNSTIGVLNETGIALAKYGDAGYGEMVAFDKYHAEDFRDELVRKSVAVLKEKLAGQGYTAITSVPSARNQKVRRFALKVAKGLGIAYIDTLEKNAPADAPQQKNMQNSYYQCKNVVDTMGIKAGVAIPSRIILIDDMVDSKWTLTVCGRLLTHSGAEKVFPYCLADSSILGD